VPYADPAESKFVLDEVAVRSPEARKMNMDDLVDNRFVKELDDSGFVSPSTETNSATDYVVAVSKAQ
jgi:hypothetical protein